MIILFDVNETLLNIDGLKDKWIKYTGNDLSKYFFAKLLHSSSIISGIGFRDDNNIEYIDFATLSKEIVKSILHENNKEETDEIIADILSAFKEAMPHNDVVEALKLLSNADIKLIAVSNSSNDMLSNQLKNAGIYDYFYKLYSVDSVQRYKPFSDIYDYVKNSLNVPANEIYMVACHDWDLYGAKNSGFNTIYINRNNSIFNPYYSKPNIEGNNLLEIANHIIDFVKPKNINIDNLKNKTEN